MRYNGVDLNTLHRAISRGHEYPPGMPRRSLNAIEGANGDIITGLTAVQEEYVVSVNIAARSYREAMEARDRLAEWACSSGKQTAKLEPTHAPGRAYDAIVKDIGRIEKKFGTVDVVFALPDGGVMYETTQRKAAGTNNLKLVVGGTAATQPESVALKAVSAAEGLSLKLNGKQWVKISGEISEGDTVEIRPKTGAVLVNSLHQESRISYTGTDFDMEMEPGKNEVSAEGAEIVVRWHNRWR